jgi:hypothetical protein
MDPVLLAGIILIVLLVAVTLLQNVVRRRQAGIERRLPHVDALSGLALAPGEYPQGYSVDYRGPVTNERLAYDSEDEDESFAEIDSSGRVIGYRQSFRDPQSHGELVDVLLNLTLRRGKTHRRIDVEVVLYEDEEGAIEGTDEELPPNPSVDDEGNSLEVTTVDGHNLGFADAVRQWSRVSQDGTELQRKLEARWHEGRISCFVTGDAEPPGALQAEDVLRVAREVHERVARSGLCEAPTTANAGV